LSASQLGLLLSQLLRIFSQPLAQGFQLRDLLARFLSMLSQRLDLLDVLIKISDQGMNQLHLVGECNTLILGKNKNLGNYQVK
jgi:hypothetical protein